MTETLHNILSSTPDFARVIVACLTAAEANAVCAAAVAEGEIPAEVALAVGPRAALDQMVDVYEDMAA